MEADRSVDLELGSSLNSDQADLQRQEQEIIQATMGLGAKVQATWFGTAGARALVSDCRSRRSVVHQWARLEAGVGLGAVVGRRCVTPGRQQAATGALGCSSRRACSGVGA